MNSKESSVKPAAPRSPKTILIVEDHPVFRKGLAQVISQEKDIAVCGTVGDAFQAKRAMARLKPDLLLLDLTLPGKSGLALIKELRASGNRVRVLVLSMHDEALYATRVLRAGGDGYIMKQEDPEEIVHAIRDILNGHIYVSEDVLRAAGSSGRAQANPPGETPLARLTDSELEILELLGQGKTDKGISRELNMSMSTLRNQTTRLRKKLKLKTNNSLIRYATCWVEAAADESP